MDSTARLVWPHAPYIDLLLHLLPAGQRNMQQNNPVPCHPQLKLRLVPSRINLLGFTEDRTHARMRHIRLDPDVRARDRPRPGIRHSERNRRRTNPERLRSDFMLNAKNRRRRRLGTTQEENEPGCSAGRS